MELTYSGKQRITEARDQINMMLQLSRIEEKLINAQKTLIIYDIYTEEKQKFLVNLHSIGGALISQKTAIFKGEIQQNDDESKTRYYLLDEQATRDSGVKIDQVQLRQEHEKNKPNCVNINIYEGVVNGNYTRVVTIPILKSLQDKQDFSKINKEKKEIQDKYFQLKKKTKGEETQILQRQCDKKVKEIDQNSIKQFLPKHLKMFIIEALLNILKKKTKAISICQVIPFSTYKNRTKKELSQTALGIFQINPQNIQFIVHSVIKKTITQIQTKKDIFSGIWTFTGEQEYKFTCEHAQWFNDSYYTRNIDKIRTKMYDIDNKSSSIGKVINMFTKSWSDIVFDSSTCIAPFIKNVYDELKYGQKLDDNLITKQTFSSKNITLSQRQNSQQIVIYTFKQIEDLYIPKSGIKQQHKIDFFFDEDRLDGFQLQKKPNPIPDDVGCICFVHFFHKINNQFCDSILTKDKQTSKNRSDYILEYLKSVYSLANNINKIDPKNKSSNMSKYFDFLSFLYNTVELIESVTKSTLPLTSVIRSFFNKLKQKQNRLLTHIQSNQDRIQANQELNYYLIYLKILDEISQNAEDSVLQIKLLLNLYKADMISAKYTIYQDKLVQAIKSYCTIISLRNKLPQTRKERFDKLVIQKRIAKLLSICKLHEQALIIFKKNHLVKSVERCYKDIFLLCDNGDERATRHIELGNYLQDQLSFAKAIDNYQCAYEFARTTEKRKEAIKAKFDCVTRKNAVKQQNEVNIQRFLSGLITEEQFDNLKKAGESKSQGDTLFETLKDKLVFEKNKCKIQE